MLVCASVLSHLVWWDLAQSKELDRVPVDSIEWANNFAVSPTGSLLASIAAGDFVRLLDWKTRQDAGEIRGPSSFTCVAFSPDGRRLVSYSGSEGALRLWDVSTQQEIARFRIGVTTSWAGVQFSPDGNMICLICLIDGKEGTAYFFRAPSFEEINAIEAEQRKKENEK